MILFVIIMLILFSGVLNPFRWVSCRRPYYRPFVSPFMFRGFGPRRPMGGPMGPMGGPMYRGGPHHHGHRGHC